MVTILMYLRSNVAACSSTRFTSDQARSRKFALQVRVVDGRGDQTGDADRVSMSSIAISSSQAHAWICVPMMRALRNIRACGRDQECQRRDRNHNDTDRAETKISVFEIRLPITGSRPTTKVVTTSVWPTANAHQTAAAR